MESYRPDSDLSREDVGCNLWHISHLENFNGELHLLSLPSPAGLGWSLAGPMPRVVAELKEKVHLTMLFFLFLFPPPPKKKQKTYYQATV